MLLRKIFLLVSISESFCLLTQNYLYQLVATPCEIQLEKETILVCSAALTKYHRVGSLELSTEIFFLTVLDTGKSKIKALADSVFENSFPGS